MCVSAARAACLGLLFVASCASDIDPGEAIDGDGGLAIDDAASPAQSSAKNYADDAAIAGKAADASASEMCRSMRVTTDGRDANLREAPSTESATIDVVADGTWIEHIATTTGQALEGIDLWYLVRVDGLEGYLFSTLATCDEQVELPEAEPDSPPKTFDGFYLPFKCGKAVRVTQGNFGSYSHQGRSKYAFDFSLGIGTPMIAMARGKVSWLYQKTKPGDPCYDGGGPSCIDKANQVWVRHPDGSTTIYAHLSKVTVSDGQAVERGDVLGHSGQTGYATGPHAHVARMKSCCQSIPLEFKDVRGGVPSTGDTVTSNNCP